MASETTPYRQPAFSAGELSPRMLGRTDVPQYHAGLARMENWLPAPTGPATRRPGTKYIATKKAVGFPVVTERSSATGPVDLNAVCHAPEIGPNGRWVAVGDPSGGDSMIVYSDDHGASWAAVPAGQIPDDEQLNDVCHANGLFVAVGNSDGTAGSVYTSLDGITAWTKRVSNAGNNHLYAVKWSGTRFVAVGAGGACVTSVNGTAWVASTGLDPVLTYRAVESAGSVVAASSEDTWVQVGTGLPIPGIQGPILCALNATDVVFLDQTLGSLRVYRWNGSGWVQVGSSFAVPGPGGPGICTLNATDIALFHHSSDQLRTYRWNGSTWSQVGTGLVITGIFAPAMTALSATDVAFVDGSQRQLRTYHWDGGAWTLAGTGLFIVALSAPALCTLNGTDVALVDESAELLRTYRWNGSVWAQVGAVRSIPGNSGPALCTLNATDIVFMDGTHDALRTFRWNGATWGQLAVGPVITGANGPALCALNGTDIAFIDSAVEELRMYRYGHLRYSTDGGLTFPNTLSGGAGYALAHLDGYWYVGGQAISRSPSLTDGTWVLVFDNASRINKFSAIGAYRVAVGTNGGFAYSLDGTTWSETLIDPGGPLHLNGIAVSGRNAVMVGDDDGSDAQLFTIPLDTGNVRLEPFVGSTGAPYLMELGHKYLRFYRDEARLESTPGVPYEIASPWDANDIADLQVAQAQDVMYITHPGYPPQRLTRTSETAFSLVSLMDTPAVTNNIATSGYRLWDGPYQDENSTVTTFDLSATGLGGGKTVTATQDVFVPTDVGRAFRIKPGNVWVWGVIVSPPPTPTVANVFVVEDNGNSSTDATARWALGAFSDTTGYPRAVSFFQQRLVFGFTRSQPQTVWMSVTAAFQEFDPTQIDDTVTDDNGLAITLATEDASHVRWIKSLRQLNVGTSAGVYQLQGDRNSNAVTPSFLSVDLASQWKVERDAIPDNVGDTLFYVQQSGLVVRGVSPGTGAEQQPNVTVLADHVTAPGVKQLVYAAWPHSVLWARRGDGLLIGCTVNPEEGTLGWHRHPLGGVLDGAAWPTVLSLTVLPVAGHEQLYLAVRRTINGVPVETIEALQLPYDGTEMLLAQACYLDCAVKREGAPTAVIPGLAHLEGQPVIAWADGLPQGPFTVSGGTVTLAAPASVVWVGLDYSARSDCRTMPLKVAGDEGQKVRAVSTLIDVLDTVDLKIGQDPDDPAKFKSIQGMAPQLAAAGAADVRMVHNASADTRFQLTLRPVGAAPATVAGLTHQMEFAQP